jgi:ADP-ribosylglycohydrolase
LDRQPVEHIAAGRGGLPAGTWSDDTSLTLCLADALCRGYSPEQVAERFLAWWEEAAWTPHGRTFGYGRTTSVALRNLQRGADPLEAGLEGEYSNGNGSLMRTLPVALYFHGDRDAMLRAAHEQSRITHGHPRSQMCCGTCCLVAEGVLDGAEPREAIRKGVEAADECYRGEPWDAERTHLDRVFGLDVLEMRRNEVRSSGYVVDTLEAALWSFARGQDFRGAVLSAVNLGGDTDTVGCVAGALAGACYGRPGIPREWVDRLARSTDIEKLAGRLYEAACGTGDSSPTADGSSRPE